MLMLFIVDTPTTEEILATRPELEATIVGDPLTEEFYGIAVREDFPELLEVINISLENVIADGTYAEIFEDYFDVPPTEDFMPDDMDDMDDEEMDDESMDDEEMSEDAEMEATAEPSEG